MTVAFPTLRPTNRSVSQGTYPVKIFKSITGHATARRYGTLPQGATLTLEYANISDSNVTLIMAAYDQAYGTFDNLLLPTQLWDDIEEPLRSRLKSTYVWRFVDAPVITQSPIPGFKSVSIQLEGQRD